MADEVGTAAAAPAAAERRRFARGAWTTAERDQAIFAVATLLAWAHTIDEARIGEVIALPFALANAALVAMWGRLTTRQQAWTSIGVGLFWALAAVPYHLVPLIDGAVTWQNVSGLARVVGGVTMIVLGIAIALRDKREEPPTPIS